jgi:LytS/YehU family sensor histidine kinase
MQALVPQFILQPLVENALRHGIGRSLEGGTIEIGARRDGDDVVLWVRDDGAGPPTEPNGDGVGMRNTRERLETMFGARGSLRLEAVPGGGTRAVIRLPYRQGEPGAGGPATA